MRFHVGSLEFDSDSGDLQVGELHRRLPPQPAAVLRLLLEQQGSMVPRGDFTAAIWPGEEFGVSERLTYCLHQLRRTLAELGMPGIIETVPRRGYRCRIDSIVAQAKEEPVLELVTDTYRPAAATARWLWRATIAAGIAALLLVALGLVSRPGTAVQESSVTASTANTTTHEQRHAARHAAQHVVP